MIDDALRPIYYAKHMKKAFGMLVVLLTISSLDMTRGSDANEKGYRWPMNIDPQLTSKFCDFRGGHFHAGIDIRTQGKTGIPIYAVDDGYIYRINISQKGYGKALYLRLRDNNIAVYGHLLSFGELLDEKVRLVQMANKKYKQDLFFEQSEYPVRKGDLLGYSGESGTGAPHLHFELRTASNKPLNPLNEKFHLKDISPPFFEKLGIRYFEGGLNLGNPCRIETIDINYSKSREEYFIKDTILVSNYIALAVAGGDRIGGNGFLYGFYGLKMFLDDSLIFQMNSDSVDYESTRQSSYIRDSELQYLAGDSKSQDGDANVFFRLYVPPHAHQYFWKGLDDYDGIIRQFNDKLVHTVKVEAADESGNMSRLKFYIKTPEIKQNEYLEQNFTLQRDSIKVQFISDLRLTSVLVQRKKTDYPAYINLDKARIWSMEAPNDSKKSINTVSFLPNSGVIDYRLRIIDEDYRTSGWIYFSNYSGPPAFNITGSPDMIAIKFDSRKPLHNPSIALFNSEGQVKLPMKIIGPQSYSILLESAEYDGILDISIFDSDVSVFDTTICIFPVEPTREITAFSPDSTLFITFPKNSAYYSAFILPSFSKVSKNGHFATIEYEIEPKFLVADNPLQFHFNLQKLNLDKKGKGAYGKSPDGDKWGFIGRLDIPDSDIRGFGLGSISIREDLEPPTIQAVSPTGTIKSQRPLLTCTLDDDLSGLDLDNGLEMYIDDIWVPAEYDIDSGIFSYRVKSSLKSGKHTLKIRVTDNQGNVVSKAINFTVLGKY